MRRKLLVLFAVLPLTICAQDEVDYVSDNEGTRTDYALWQEVGLVKLLPYDFSLSIDAGYRTEDNFRDFGRGDVGLSLNWKANKYWKFGVGYTFITKHYLTETERKTVNTTERKYKYTATDAAGVETDWEPDPTEIHGIPWYQDDNGTYVTTETGNKYLYKGYNDIDKTKDYVRVTDDFWRMKHRLSADVAYTSNRIGGWLRISLRERYQVTYVPKIDVQRTRTKTTYKTTWRYRTPTYDYTEDGELFIDSYGNVPGSSWSSTTHPENPENSVTTEVEESTKTKDSKWLHTLRSRLTLEIDKKGWDWTPYVYVEAFNDLASNMNLDKLRASIGVDYAVAKNAKLGIGYIFNHENDDDGNENIHALNVSYKYKF